jgi:hypothetical protein
MSKCFQLLDKKTGEAAILNKVDEEVAVFCNEPVHAHNWCMTGTI